MVMRDGSGGARAQCPVVAGIYCRLNIGVCFTVLEILGKSARVLQLLSAIHSALEQSFVDMLYEKEREGKGEKEQTWEGESLNILNPEDLHHHLTTALFILLLLFFGPPSFLFAFEMVVEDKCHCRGAKVKG